MGEQIIFKGRKFDYLVVVKDNYVGAFLRAKRRRKGETWLRGNDLPDGPNCSATWIRIVHKIMDCETGRDYTRQILSHAK